YYDYAWWAKLDRAQDRIVPRLKSNTPLTTIEELLVTSDGPILSDRIGHLPARLSKNRNNPFEDPVREVRVKLDSGKVLRILSNDLDAPAAEIAELYKRRWAIELFFHWVKQRHAAYRRRTKLCDIVMSGSQFQVIKNPKEVNMPDKTPRL